MVGLFGKFSRAEAIECHEVSPEEVKKLEKVKKKEGRAPKQIGWYGLAREEVKKMKALQRAKERGKEQKQNTQR